MKTVDTLVDDIYAAVEEGFEPDFAYVTDFQEDVAAALLKQFKPANRKRGNHLRMSNIGKPDCQLWHEINETDGEGIDAQTRVKFLFGDLIEALMLYLVKEAGHKVTHEQAEVEVNGIKGHMDCRIDGVPVDVKSASPFGYKKFKEGTLAHDDPFGYMAQISGYAEPEKDESAGFLAFEKVLGKIAYMRVDRNDMIDVPSRVDHMKEVVSLEEPPERCFEPVPDGKSGNMKLPTNCSYCAFKKTCWSDANDGDGLRLFLYSTGPRWLVEVEKLPKVPEKLADGTVVFLDYSTTEKLDDIKGIPGT